MCTIRRAHQGVSEKKGGTLCWGPYNKDPTILGYYLRVPYFRKPPSLDTSAKKPETLQARTLAKPESLVGLALVLECPGPQKKRFTGFSFFFSFFLFRVLGFMV